MSKVRIGNLDKSVIEIEYDIIINLVRNLTVWHRFNDTNHWNTCILDRLLTSPEVVIRRMVPWISSQVDMYDV